MNFTNKTSFGLFIGAWMLVIALGVITITLANENRKLRISQKVTNDREQHLSVVVDRYVDADDNKHAIIKENPVTRKQIKDGTAIPPAYIDSLATALKLAKRDITESTSIIATLKGQLKGTVRQDSAKGKITTFKGPYLEAWHTESDTVLNYKYNARFDIVKYDNKKWFLGKRHYYQDISAKDPDMYIDGVRNYTIAQGFDTRRFGIGLQVGYYYDPVSGSVRPSIGAGLSYNLVTF
ncbi:MAG: hypothetical protein H7Y13_11820 [Sphingobacteriaceae bacterium]|nr:hypothetical protein [Sphingobacteriaceae bacterium]